VTKHEVGTTSVIDGKPVSSSDFQARLGELAVEAKPASTANLEDSDGSFGGTEEHYVARSKSGDVYDYMIVRSATHQHYELTRRTPTSTTEWTLDGRTVDEQAFEQTMRTLEVDAEPWINRHLKGSDGSSGSGATFEARDRKTGELWTYDVRSVGGHTSRSLARGSRKSTTPARQ